MKARLARYAKRSRPRRLVQRQPDRHSREVVCDASAHHVGRGRRAALVRHVDRGDSRHQVEELAAQMIRIADAGGGEGKLPGLGLGARNELLHVLRRELGRHDEDVRRRGHRRERHEVGVRLVRQVRQRGRADREPVLREEQRVAIRRALSDRIGGQVARRAGARLHIHALPPVRGQAVGHHPRDDVGRAAGGVADDDPHRLRRVLRIRYRRREQRGECKQSHDHLIAYIFLPATGMSAVTISPFAESVT